MGGKKKVCLSVGVLLAALGCWYGLVEREASPAFVGVSSKEASAPVPLVQADALVALPVPEVKQPVSDPASAERLNENGGLVIESPWQEAEVDADFPLAEPSAAAEQPLAIVLQDDALANAHVGDSVSLPLPDSSTLQAKVTQVELQQGGKRNWQGEIQVDGSSYPVNFTVDKKATFGFIGTPQGSYTVETLGGKGWVYKNPPLDLGHGGDDGMIPTRQ
ncbi:MAG: hypothetical protein ACRCR1_06430 [Aeromonas sp.]